MTIMQIFGFFCSMLIGLSLGLMGGGGSVLTIPVLVYLLGINPILSTVYSLFVVGTTSLVGSVYSIRKQQVHYRAVLLFSLPSFVAIIFARRYIIPAIPDPIRVTESVRFSKNGTFILLFAVIMLAASVSMITGRKPQESAGTSLPRHNYPLLIVTGVLVGTLTGLAGIGGGFLIIPALISVGRLPMKRAVGTSLLIIAANSLIGFLSNTGSEPINWPFLLGFTALAVFGILIGSYVSRFISSFQLRKAFGWLILLLSIVIIGKEAFTSIFSHNDSSYYSAKACSATELQSENFTTPNR